MPNWCEGVLKIRGKQEDVFNLLADNLQVWNTVIIRELKFDMREELDKEAIKIDREDGTIYVEKTALLTISANLLNRIRAMINLIRIIYQR